MMNRIGLLISSFFLLAVARMTAAAEGNSLQTPPLEIDKVFFAQHHVQSPDNPLFKLVGELETLVKVQVYADEPVMSPYVFACLELDGQRRDIRLVGPATLPKRPVVDPVMMEHSYADSFTATIPKQWIRSGLKVAVELREYDYSSVGLDDHTHTNCVAGDYVKAIDRVEFDKLSIGAPTKLVMQVFDMHYFGRGKGADLPEGWLEELAARLPVSELVVHRVKDIMLDEIVMPPRGEFPSMRFSGMEDYKRKTGVEFDGEQAIALRWGSALKRAGGRFTFWRPYYINICGVHSGGQGGGYRACGSIHRHGTMIHELGHAFGLPHWQNSRQYPYKRTSYGDAPGEPAMPNVGPTWAFDLGRRQFMAPCEIVDGALVWRKDPMNGGGWSQEQGTMFRFFSDYSVSRMQERFESRAVYWNEDVGQYATWNQETGAYDQVVENDGVSFPTERDVDVVSLMATANLAVPDANIVYPPIGPYKAGLILRFDADSSEARAKAVELGYAAEEDNVALRVTQGGQTRTYLMPESISPDDDPLNTFNVTAINLPAADGEVTRAELLYCPDLITRGVTHAARVLDVWVPQG